MKVYVVTERDYDDAWIVAVYATQAMADEHVELMGVGYVEECDIRETLHPDAVDPVKQAERKAEAERARAQYEVYQESQAREAKRRAEMRPNPPHMRLCTCRTDPSPWRMNDHGYCSYCGGFEPSVFMREMGREATAKAIADLDIYERRRMTEIVAGISSVESHRPPEGNG